MLKFDFIKAYLGCLLCFFLSINLNSQEHYAGNLWLTASEESAESEWHLYVNADLERLRSFLDQNEGLYQYTFQGFHAVLLSKKAALDLTREDWVKQIRIQGGKGRPLLNESRINAKTDSVHLGHPNLPSAYTGKGVIMGFIDTGIDFLHPDFQDTNGNTRILQIWDQTLKNNPGKSPFPYGYGEVYDSADINQGKCPHIDPSNYSGHGTMVCGVGAGNGNSVPDSIADYRGHAPDAHILFVASDFNANNWTQTVADGVEWIFTMADSYGMPCVINISAGDYLGSHDGLDLPALFIDSLVKAKPGRAIVCAAGNGGALEPFHLRGSLNDDTLFTWFRPGSNTRFGHAVVFELWADTANFNQLEFGVGYTDTTLWQDNLIWKDSIQFRLDRLGFKYFGGSNYMTWAEIQGDRYLLQVIVTNPKDQYHYYFQASGTGEYDVWSAAWMGTSDMVHDHFPTSTQYPNIKYVQAPDTLQSMVSSWACSPNVLTVANYNNRSEYENVDGGKRQYAGLIPGDLGGTSSSGPNRRGHLKPDISAPGNVTVTSGRIVDVQLLANTPSARYKLAVGGYHFSNGGTSMASPVVAGIAALMLEKCPKLTNKEISENITNTAFKDGFTGSQDNYDFGHGKVDGLASLMQTNFGDKLFTTTGKNVICAGNKLTISTNIYHSKYVWNDGDVNVFHIADSIGPVWATLENSKGCKGFTDTIHLIMRGLPTVELVGDSILCSEIDKILLYGKGAQKYRWSTGEYKDSILVNRAGMIRMVGMDSNLCESRDSILIISKDCYAGVSDEGDSFWSVYPNPFQNELTMRFSSLTVFPLAARIVNLQGQEMAKAVIQSTDEFKWNLELLNGAYILELSGQDQKSLKKLLVQH